MKVLLLGPYPPPEGGVQSHIVAIRRYLLAHGHGCAVLTITRHQSAVAEEVYHPKSAWQVLQLLWTLPADIIHLHVGLHTGQSFAPRLILLSLVCSWLPGRRAVFTFHSGGYPNSPEGQQARPGSLRGFVFRQFAGVIGVNEALVDVFRRYGVRPERIRMIPPHAVSLEAAAAATLPAHLESFLLQHDPVFFTAGGLEPEYDLGLQIDVLGRIRAQYPRAGLILAGAGSKEDEIRARIDGKLYAADVLLYGNMPHAVALLVMQRATMMLRTTLCDGDSVSVREALHLGLPVIATENGMRPSGVHTFPVGDAAALERSILAVLSGNAERAPAEGGGDENVAALVHFYQELLPGAAAAASPASKGV